MDEKQLQLLRDNGINVDSALGRFGGRAELLRKFILRFLDDNSYSKLSAALDAGDAEEAFMAAHTLKGVASNLALDPLFTITDKITELLRPKTPDCIDKAKDNMDELTEIYDKMVDVIEMIR